MSKRLLGVLVALVACGGSAPKATPSAPPPPPAAIAIALRPPPPDPDAAPLPLWPDVRHGRLANGMSFFIMKHRKPEKRALLWLAVNVGSVQEDNDQRGLAHFAEHMAFNGTKRFPKNEIVNYLEKIGMKFGADLNAHTQFDQTVYQLEVPTDRPRYVSKGLDIVRDWAGDVTYDPVEVDKERGVVLEEWRLRRGAAARLFDKHAKVLFAGTRYADRIVLGDPQIIKNAKRDVLYRFYKDWYRPDELSVIAVGDFDPAQIEREIRTKFGDVAAPEHERTRLAGGVPPATGTRVSIETDPEATGTVVEVANVLPHRALASKRDHRRSLGEHVYAMILNERLATLGRKQDAPFLAAFGSMQALVRDIDVFERAAQVKGDHVEDAVRALFTEVIRMERHGITATELARARANVMRMFDEQAEREATLDSRDFADEITRHFFANELMIGGVAERDLTREMLPNITVDELNALAKNFGGADNRVIVISAPSGDKAPHVPSKERVLAIVDDIQKAAVEPWRDEVPPQALMASPPTPGTIVKETKLEKLGVTEWTLSNGARVIVKPTDYELDSVELEGESPGGLAMATDKDFANARFAAEVAAAGGVGELDSQALTKVLAGKQVRVSTALRPTTENVSARGSAHDLETMLQLVYLKMAAPRRDEAIFTVFKQNLAQQLDSLANNPEFVFARDATAAKWANHPRETLPRPDDIAKIDLDKALAFYKDRFGDATDFTFVIVGVVDVDKLRPLVEAYLASLPAHGRKETEKDLGMRKVHGVVKKQWQLGTEPKAMVHIEFHGDETWTRDKERDIRMLGEVLTIRLRETLREDMGGIYSLQAGGQITRAPHQERTFSISFGCDPARVDELVAATFGEIAKLQNHGVSDDPPVSRSHSGSGGELTKVKQTFLRKHQTEIRRNSYWTRWLVSASRYGDDPAFALDAAADTARATSANIQASVKRYLDRKQYFQAVMVAKPVAAAPAAVAPAAPSQQPPPVAN